jgi:hypothetical protein
MSQGIGYIDANLNDVEPYDGGTSLVNPGEYHLKATKIMGGTSQSGNSKMVVTYEILEAIGDLADENADMKGRTIVQSYSLNLTNDTVRARLRSLTEALGVKDERGGFDPDGIVDAEMVAEVIAQTYTKSNPVTGQPEERQSLKLIRERNVDDYFDDEPEADKPEPEPKPKTTRGRGRRNAQPRA